MILICIHSDQLYPYINRSWVIPGQKIFTFIQQISITFHNFSVMNQIWKITNFIFFSAITEYTYTYVYINMYFHADVIILYLIKINNLKLISSTANIKILSLLLSQHKDSLMNNKFCRIFQPDLWKTYRVFPLL